jgi:hypothetical protein
MTELRTVELSAAQLTALERARSHGGQITGAAPALLAALERKGLAERAGPNDWRWTELGRYQVKWFSDDCAAYWNVRVPAWNIYVTRGTAPEPAYPGTPKSTTDRAWWDPAQVRAFVRPTNAGPEKQRVKLDNAEVLRLWRTPVPDGEGGEKRISIEKMAERFKVSTTTMSAVLERMGEKAPTSASLRAGNGPQPQGHRVVAS